LKRILLLFFIGSLFSLFSCNQEKSTPNWVALFNGQDLDGWKILGGKATYQVIDNAIVGTSQLNTPNTFLTTKKVYSDFILELEYKVDPLLNSGIQIRSNSIPEYYNGSVHGYQVEIDPSDRAWSGGIYDESRRGWLNPLSKNPAAQKAFKQNEWNKYRIEAIGDTIKTWINDVEAAYLIDDATRTGFIGLQVHGIGKDTTKIGTQVAWRNIKMLTEDLQKYARKSSIKPIVTKNNLTINEEESGWKMLWDGKTFDGWKSANSNVIPTAWEIDNGNLIVNPAKGEHDIITKKTYKDFQLSLEFKLTEGANSGLKYYVNQFGEKENSPYKGLEFQILDDKNNPDAMKGDSVGSRTVGSLYDIFPPNGKKYVQPIDEWNRVFIVSRDQKVTHWFNNIKILEYDRTSEEFKAAIANSKFKDVEGFGLSTTGHILLQEHDSKVSFRSIKIKEFKEE
jgi:hypothetical protein